MKTPLLFIFLSLGSFVIADQNAEFHCNLENYQDFISKLGVHECHLLGANLFKANLQRANLTSADLREANLWNANLQEASLLGANLQGASLIGTNLQGANLYKADLRGAKVTQKQAVYLYSQGLDLSGLVVQ